MKFKSLYYQARSKVTKSSLLKFVCNCIKTVAAINYDFCLRISHTVKLKVLSLAASVRMCLCIVSAQKLTNYKSDKNDAIWKQIVLAQTVE